MAFASSSEARIAYVAEATFGTTPATPTFKILRVTGGGLRSNKATVTSSELRADGNVADEMMVGVDVSGTYPVEVSYSTLDDMLEAALMGTWTTNVLKNGMALKSFTFEETLELGATDSFSRFPGCCVNTFELTLNSRAEILASFALMGQKEILATAIVSGATYTAANTEPVMTSGVSVASLTVGSISPAPTVRALSLSVGRNLRTRPALTSLYTAEFGKGRCDVTGTLEAYFESNALYQAVLDHGGGSISFTVGNTANKKYTVLIPNARFLDGSRAIAGNDADVMVSIPFRGIYDATEGCSIKITRAVA